MTKAKTNALDALRSLIAERQQYEQWIASLEARKEGTPEHVFDRVKGDYQARLERVIGDIGGHAEELQLSISTLSSRLVEVAREEDTRREGLQEAELRAAVGEYDPEQWEQLRKDSERALEKIAADRASLDSQLSELRAIQKLSEVGSTGSPLAADTEPVPRPTGDPAAARESYPAATQLSADLAGEASQATQGARATIDSAPAPSATPSNDGAASAAATAGSGGSVSLRGDESRRAVDSSAAAAQSGGARGSKGRTPPGGVSVRPKSEPPRPDATKTLKCPECGTPNHATEWYCERCGGELATM